MEWLGIDLRRLGTAMLAFGIVGVTVAGIVAAGLIAGAIGARNLDERLAADQARLVQSLQRVDSTMAQLVTTVDNASTTLGTTSTTLANASTVLDQVADTSAEIAGSLDVSILGNRPLATAADQFAKLATQVRAFGDDAQRLSENLAVNATDVGDLAGELDELRAELATLTVRVAAFEATGELVALLVGGILLLGLLIAWVAVAAAGCAWIGLRLRRLGSTEGLSPAAGIGPRSDAAV